MTALIKTETDRVREAVRQFLETPESFPLVVPCPRMQDKLNERHAKADRRKYTGEPITNFGELA